MKKTASSRAPQRRPYRQKARAEASEATARRIMGAFFECRNQRWYDEITLEEVAKRAGVTVRTVIRRFGGKDGLMASTFQHIAPRIREQRTVPPGDIGGAIARVVELYEELGDGAIRDLADHRTRAQRIASVYETEPHGDKNQPWFLNTVIEAATELDPPSLLEACLSIERFHGRVRRVSGGPRTLDLDIIFYEDRIIQLPNLSLPHPRLYGRRFVLAPLAEIAPAFIDPLSGETIAHLLNVTPDTAAIRRCAPPPAI